MITWVWLVIVGRPPPAGLDFVDHLTGNRGLEVFWFTFPGYTPPSWRTVRSGSGWKHCRIGLSSGRIQVIRSGSGGAEACSRDCRFDYQFLLGLLCGTDSIYHTGFRFAVLFLVFLGWSRVLEISSTEGLFGVGFSWFSGSAQFVGFVASVQTVVLEDFLDFFFSYGSILLKFWLS